MLRRLCIALPLLASGCFEDSMPVPADGDGSEDTTDPNDDEDGGSGLSATSGLDDGGDPADDGDTTAGPALDDGSDDGGTDDAGPGDTTGPGDGDGTTTDPDDDGSTSLDGETTDGTEDGGSTGDEAGGSTDGDPTDGATTDGGLPGPLSIDAIDPPLGNRDQSVEVVLHGSGFAPGIDVTFGTVLAAQVQVFSATEVHVVVPATPGAYGPVDVVVGDDDEEVTVPDGYRFFTPLPTFSGPGPLHALDTGTTGIRVGDLVGDAAPDVALLSNYAANNVTVWENYSTGNFTLAAGPYTMPGGDARTLALGDIDDDGDLDIAVAYQCCGSGMTVLRNDGAGGFDPVDHLLGLAWLSTVELADFDADGDLDAIVAADDTNGQTVAVLDNDGWGGLTLDQTWNAEAAGYALATASHFAVVDIDGDDFPEIVAGVTGGDFGAGVVALANDAGVLGAPTFVPAPGGGVPRDASAADFDADGVMDVVVGTWAGTQIWRLLSDGAGGFEPVQAHASTPSPARTGTGDLNGDGRPDVAVCRSDFEGAIGVHRNDGGSFSAPVWQGALGVQCARLAVADVDGDGANDIVLAQGGVVDDQPQHGFVVVRNTSAD